MISGTSSSERGWSSRFGPADCQKTNQLHFIKSLRNPPGNRIQLLTYDKGKKEKKLQTKVQHQLHTDCQ